MDKIKQGHHFSIQYDLSMQIKIAFCLRCIMHVSSSWGKCWAAIQLTMHHAELLLTDDAITYCLRKAELNCKRRPGRTGSAW